MKVRPKPAFWRTTCTAKGIPLVTEYGNRRSYQLAEYQGLLGNRKEPSWNAKEQKHDCCGAKVSWRHKRTCPARQPDVANAISGPRR